MPMNTFSEQKDQNVCIPPEMYMCKLESHPISCWFVHPGLIPCKRKGVVHFKKACSQGGASLEKFLTPMKIFAYHCLNTF